MILPNDFENWLHQGPLAPNSTLDSDSTLGLKLIRFNTKSHIWSLISLLNE